MRFSFHFVVPGLSTLLVAIEAAAATIAPPPGKYTVSQIATNAGYATVNNSGQVAGTSPIGGIYSNFVFLWNPLTPNGTVGSLTELGSEPTVGRTLDPFIAINDRGQVAATDNMFIRDSTRILLWSPNAPNGASG